MITVTEHPKEGTSAASRGGWVDLIHETLIRGKQVEPEGEPEPYWPTLWRYIEQNAERAAWRESERSLKAARRLVLRAKAREWADRRGLKRVLGLGLARDKLRDYGQLDGLGSVERRYIRWNRCVLFCAIAAPVVFVFLPYVSAMVWVTRTGFPLNALPDYLAYARGEDLPLPATKEVPAGSFLMGSIDGPDSEQPAHKVTFAAPFHVTSTEVTYSEWLACFVDGGCPRLRSAAPARSGPRAPAGWKSRPVASVSWHDARAYVAWLSRKRNQTCRLPSEAEWEYACRAGSPTAYGLPPDSPGDDIAGKGLAHCEGCGGTWEEERPAPVGSFAANAWGLQDMHGNVWEWVEDCWHGDYLGAPEDGQAWSAEARGDCAMRVLRGGSYKDSSDDLRCSNRIRAEPDERGGNAGFRVVCLSPIESE